MGPGKKKGWQ
jgi:hypothetical protein